jgi:hypothetical protein
MRQPVYQLTPAIIDRIRGHIEIEASLMLYFGISGRTVRNWINDNDIRLTVPGVVQIIREKLKLDPETEILIKF